MRNLVGLLTIPFLTVPVAAAMLSSPAYACNSITCSQVIPRGCYKDNHCNSASSPQQLAQLTQYYPAQMMAGGGAPVIVPPTVINTQGYEHNSSKKSCKESVIDLFLFSVRRTTGDCTP
jgi:hypothetical protein